MLMQLPNIGQNKNQPQYYYQNVPPPASKKKVFLVGAGIVALLGLLLAVVLGGGSKAGEQDMQNALTSTSDAIGIISKYENDLRYAPTQNDVALTKILLRGNFQQLNELYNKTYKPRKKFSASPKADAGSATQLDRAKRSNTLDNEIIEALKTKVLAADKSLVSAKSAFKTGSSKTVVQDSITDLDSIEDLLARAR